MANTRQSTKRAKQAKVRESRNRVVRSATRTTLSAAIAAITKKDTNAAAAYALAVKTLAKAATKGSLPAGRAARKISRLTLLAKKVNPAALQTPPASK